MMRFKLTDRETGILHPDFMLPPIHTDVRFTTTYGDELVGVSGQLTRPLTAPGLTSSETIFISYTESSCVPVGFVFREHQVTCWDTLVPEVDICNDPTPWATQTQPELRRAASSDVVALHYYAFAFAHGNIKASVYRGFQHNFVSVPQIEDAKICAEVPADAVLISLSYMGYMTEFQVRNAKSREA